MNTLGSEYSSGCESGWTLYLEHSFLNKNASSHGGGAEGFSYEKEHKDKRFIYEEDSEEDLSMVSDASSGPPHFEPYFNEQVNSCFYSPSKAVNLAKSDTKNLAKSDTKRKKVRENKHLEDQHLPSFLHDTASSPVLDFSTNNVTRGNQQSSIGSVLDYSQGFSTNYFEGSSPFQEEHFGFLQSENELQGNKFYGGKGMGIR